MDLLGFHRKLLDLKCVAAAAKARVAHWENLKNGGLRIVSRARALREVIAGSGFLGRTVSWKNWFSHAFICNLQEATREVRVKDVGEVSIVSLGDSPHQRKVG